MNAEMNEGGLAPIRVMAHLVSGYPTTAIAHAAAQGLAEGGVSYFEIQFPFSDPSADGKAIQTACAEVLSRGYRVAEGFAFASELHSRYPAIPVYIMTYGNLAYKIGIDEFVQRAARSGVSGLIIPDLPFDADEGLSLACERHGLVSIPVAAPSMTDSRLSSLAALKRPYVYAALRAGITGSATTIDSGTVAFIESVAGKAGGQSKDPASAQGTRILGGFGIRTGEQSRALSPHVHAVVAGSVFVELIQKYAPLGEDAVRRAVAEKARELSALAH
jgi:tryptophan synthase alpha chain